MSVKDLREKENLLSKFKQKYSWEESVYVHGDAQVYVSGVKEFESVEEATKFIDSRESEDPESYYWEMPQNFPRYESTFNRVRTQILIMDLVELSTSREEVSA